MKKKEKKIKNKFKLKIAMIKSLAKIIFIIKKRMIKLRLKSCKIIMILMD